MRIVDIETYVCHFPHEPFSPSWTPGITSRSSGVAIFVVKTDEGVSGFSGAMAIGNEWSGLAPLVRAYLLGRDPLKIEPAVEVLRNSTRVLGYRAGFLDIALWDIAGKVAGLPLWRLFGGIREEVSAYASFGELRSPQAWAEAALAAREHGFKALKVRVRHETVAEDVAVVASVREVVGDSMQIAVDANQGWRIEGFAPTVKWDLARAKTTARAIEEFYPMWLEEPLDQYDARGHISLRAATATPIAGGEMLNDLGPFQLMIDAGSYDVVQPDAIFCGGMTIQRKISALAEAHGIGFAPHTWSNGIGLLANLHTLAAAPTGLMLEYPWDPMGWVPEVRDAMFSEPIKLSRDGTVILPDAPGLGIELDMEKILAHGERVA